MKTCNHGLNLPQAQHVFLIEPSLQPALEEQAIARVRRLYQPICCSKFNRSFNSSHAVA